MKTKNGHTERQFEHFPVSGADFEEKSLNFTLSANQEQACFAGQFLNDSTSINRKLHHKLDKLDNSEKLLQWEMKKSQLVYNFQDCSVDPTKLKASNYKYMRSTFLPGAQDPKIELGHELRKQESLKVFQDLTQKSDNKFPAACKSNLSASEQKGLKSLKERISKGELVVCQSDKSNKLCVGDQSVQKP